MISNHLRYFIEVADQKSFTKAAEKLYISQSTISKAVIFGNGVTDESV